MSQKILILGAGYGGMMTALRLAGKTRRLPVEITLVNALESFVERLRLHETATGTVLKGHPIRHMLRGTRVKFVQGWAEQILTEKHEVRVKVDDAVQRLPYDFLVLAFGSQINQDAVEGIRENAYVLNPYGHHDAHALRDQLAQHRGQNAKVIVVGGGATGIESAAQIKTLYPSLQVSLVTQGQAGSFKNDRRVQAYMSRTLSQQGVRILEHSQVAQVVQNALILADGKRLDFDLCLWAGGFHTSSLAGEAGLAVNEGGRLLVDGCLRSISDPHIYAVGDAAQPTTYTGAPYRMSVFAAMTTGAHTADNLAARLKGKAEKPFSFSPYGQGIALGKDKGIGFLTLPDDQPRGPLYKGMFGLRMRNFFVWFLLFALELERRFPGFFYWLGKGRHAKVTKSQLQKIQPTMQVK